MYPMKQAQKRLPNCWLPRSNNNLFSTAFPEKPSSSILVAFLEKAMAKDADQRYQTGDEFAAALRAAFAGGTAPARGVVDVDLGS